MNKDYLSILIHDEQNSCKIQPGEFIPLEIFLLLKEGTKTSQDACFSRTGTRNSTYIIEVPCKSCNEVESRELTKQEILEVLNNPDKTLCSNCIKTTTVETAKDEERRYATAVNTLRFIEKYLYPTSKNIYPEYAETQIASFKNFLRNLDDEKICEVIRKMSYDNFLQTLYWKAVSYILKSEAGFKCKLCGSDESVIVHHNTYENHGYEHIRQVMSKDLIVLCDKCHSKFHNK